VVICKTVPSIKFIYGLTIRSWIIFFCCLAKHLSWINLARHQYYKSFSKYFEQYLLSEKFFLLIKVSLQLERYSFVMIVFEIENYVTLREFKSEMFILSQVFRHDSLWNWKLCNLTGIQVWNVYFVTRSYYSTELE
jgi:hypothetical protein